jgi:hypothetical protein
MKAEGKDKPKVEYIQQWLIRNRKDNKFLIISSFYKKTPWVGLEAAIFHSKSLFHYLSVKDFESDNHSLRLRDMIGASLLSKKLKVVFTKWEDSTVSKARNSAIDYVLVGENEEFTLKSEDIEIIIEI